MEILSQMWSFLGVLTVLQNVLPSQILSLLTSVYDSLHDLFTPFSYYDIPEFNGYCGVDVNELYRHVHLYLNSSSSSSSSCRRMTLSRSKSSNRVSFTLAPNHSVPDSFSGHSLSWTHHVDAVGQDSVEERRSFTLRLPKRHRHSLLAPFLLHVSSRALELERVSRERRLFTNNGNASSCWVSVPFRHPSTFDTLALGPDLRANITADLTAFSQGRDFYHRVGRAWKRGYLLYGPPGSGKSSLIAAMANFLCYDVYDLELTKVTDNSELRALLMQTTNRSIIVIEDIDCSLDVTGDRSAKRKNKEEEDGGRVTLSGLLNFTDGLWSCCGEERIIVFTTNHRDSVDPALLRCGRMDVHVGLGTCGTHATRELARKYLGVEEHRQMEVAERCIRAGGGLTPAHVGEIMLRNRGDVDLAIKELVAAMQARMLDSTQEPRSPDSVLMAGSPENWGNKSKEGGSVWERKAKFLVRLKSLTKSDSGIRGT